MKFFTIPGWACTANYFDELQESTCFDWAFYKEQSSDIDTFIEDLKNQDKDFILLAYSLGCLYALDAAQGISHCRGLILLSPFASFCGEGRGAKLIGRQIKLMIKGIEQDAAKTIAQFQASAGSVRIETELYNKTQLKLGLEILINKEFLGPEPKVPTLLLRGQEDKIVPHTQFEALKKLLPSAKAHTFKNAPHDLLEEPSLNKVIIDFVESLHD